MDTITELLRYLWRPYLESETAKVQRLLEKVLSLSHESQDGWQKFRIETCRQIQWALKSRPDVQSAHCLWHKEVPIRPWSGVSCPNCEFDFWKEVWRTKNVAAATAPDAPREPCWWDTLKVEEPKDESSRRELPKHEAPWTETLKKETPRSEHSRRESPKRMSPKRESPKREAPKVEIPKTEIPGNEASTTHGPTFDTPRVQDNSLSAYATLHADREAFLKDHINNPFPGRRELGLRACKNKNCFSTESLRCCHHDLARVLRSSGEYSRKWLMKERTFWHPDKFVGRGEGQDMAQDMFKMIQHLIKLEPQ